MRIIDAWYIACVAGFLCGHVCTAGDELPGTQPLAETGDLAAKMVDGIDRYLTGELAASVAGRQARWKLDDSSLDAYCRSVEPQRQRLREILGVIDARVPNVAVEVLGAAGQLQTIAETDTYSIYMVRWPVLPGVDAEGLWLKPKGRTLACVVALPDADWTPEMLAGLAPHPDLPRERGEGSVEPAAQFARRLAENWIEVLAPTLIDRRDTWSGNPRVGRTTNQPHREFVYRMAFEMGRHIIGYEVQKVLAAVDWFCRDKDHPPVGVYGYGEGGAIAFYAGALDERIQATVVNGYFGPREKLWQEPIYRNVFGLLRDFGDAEIAARLYLPVSENGRLSERRLLIENGKRPEITGPPPPRSGRSGAAPGRLGPVSYDDVEGEFLRMFGLRGEKHPGRLPHYLAHTNQATVDTEVLQQFMATLSPSTPMANWDLKPDHAPAVERRKDFNPDHRQQRQFEQLVAFTQRLQTEGTARRQESFWSKLDYSSGEKYQASLEPHRKRFWEVVIGKLPAPTVPMNPRTRLAYDVPKWKGYEVTLDLFPDVFAYGILLVPNDLKPGERRPVIVCQHGLEGRPQDVVNPKARTRAYNSYGAQLVDKGYIVYAPQNPYIGQDKFRVLQRKANPLGLSLFSFIVSQHERTLDWLATLPFVDPERMAFYGLSYGGKTAMRVPSLLPRYCLSICSGDFNEWIWKNVTMDWRGSYMFTGEYEMYEFDLGNTFNYAEMAALIAPRPFMVERGHDDGVGLDEWVAFEYAKVRRLYDKLGLGERTAIEFFNGGHEIKGKGTFEFLERHLGKR